MYDPTATKPAARRVQRPLTPDEYARMTHSQQLRVTRLAAERELSIEEARKRHRRELREQLELTHHENDELRLRIREASEKHAELTELLKVREADLRELDAMDKRFVNNLLNCANRIKTRRAEMIEALEAEADVAAAYRAAAQRIKRIWSRFLEVEQDAKDSGDGDHLIPPRPRHRIITVIEQERKAELQVAQAAARQRTLIPDPSSPAFTKALDYIAEHVQKEQSQPATRATVEEQSAVRNTA